MYRHTRIKVRLGRAHLDGDAKALQHLGAAEANDVQADDALVLALADELVGCRPLVLEHGVVHGREGGLVHLDVCVAVLLARLGLGETDGADLGVREYDGGDVAVVELGGGEFGAAEETVGEAAAGGDGNCVYVLAGLLGVLYEEEGRANQASIPTSLIRRRSSRYSAH